MVQKSDEFKLEIVGEFAGEIDKKNNLFTKILDFFVQEFQISKNLHIKITKNIPVGAGLGGGSSDAAFFMRALNEIFSLNLSVERLQKISLRFGSDIAFLLQNQAAIVKGRGEEITKFLSAPTNGKTEVGLVTIKIKPSIRVGNELVKYPGFISIDKEVSSKILL